ncbi:PhzF family phenazine biosynthesis protein [Thiosocius teredinicola]|uniref:PhzF family phenazine biosynthesis protein n=1 Tax=Thiosocius teredinicola TaxID=1973002 RepID=UPI000991088E
MPVDIFTVDAFSAAPFAGNPAAVCLLQKTRPDRWLQAVAAEMNLSETAFLLPGDGAWQLRWFTPRTEVDLCGHATLASAHVLWNELGHANDRLLFDTLSGRLAATRVADRIELDFPLVSIEPTTTPEALGEALNAKVRETHRAGSDLLVLLASADAVRSLMPDFRRLAAIDVRGIIATSTGDDGRYDFISRFFAPRVGIDEDPVTGSAHCALAAFWGERLQRGQMLGYQASGRGGVVEVELAGERVRLRGQAVTTLKGVLYAD